MATITKRGESYRIKVSCGYDTTGKQVIQSMTWKLEPTMTAKQADKELNRQAVLFEEACMKGKVVAAVKFETFAEQWFDEYARPNLKSTSYERMKLSSKRVYPALGYLRLDKITSRHVQKFITDISTNGKHAKTGKPLARKTILQYLSFISIVFDYAIKLHILSDNPCRGVSVPKGEKREKQVYTLEETKQFFILLQTAPLKYRLFFTLLIYSGFRNGEMLGLEWKDIDHDNCIISVHRASNYTIEKGTYTDTTKTKKSQRSLKFPQFIMNLLKEFQAEQTTEIERLGDKWEDNDRLFTKWNGKPMNPHTPYLWLRKFCEKNNFRFCDIHSFRHLNASLLINAGIDVTSVSAALGHSQTSTTLNIYSHYFQAAQAKTSEAIASALDFSSI